MKKFGLGDEIVAELVEWMAMQNLRKKGGNGMAVIKVKGSEKAEEVPEETGTEKKD